MVKQNYIYLHLNSSEKLYFEIVNDLRWTKVFYCFNGLKIYLGANCYEEIINGLSKGLFTKKIPKVYSFKAINNKVKTKIIEYKNKKIYWLLNLMEPHFSFFRTYKSDKDMIFFQDKDCNFIKEIDIDKKYLKFE